MNVILKLTTCKHGVVCSTNDSIRLGDFIFVNSDKIFYFYEFNLDMGIKCTKIISDNNAIAYVIESQEEIKEIIENGK